MGYTIYLRTNLVNGLQYVGQTKDLRRRNNHWKCLNWYYANQYLTEERAKYGLDNFNLEIIDLCETQEEADKLEQHYIKEYGTKYPNGYNMGCGGKRNVGFSRELSKEQKQKISEIMKEKYKTEIHHMVGKHLSEETKKKISEANKGENAYWFNKHHSEETRKRISEAQKGRKLTEAWVINSAIGHYKPVNQYDIKGNFIKTWSSIKEATETLNIKGSISRCCKGKQKTAGGYIWKYKNEGI